MHYSYGTDNNPMLLDNVNCPNNNYLTILQCSYSTDINDECNANSFDATVNCCKLYVLFLILKNCHRCH